LADVIGDRLYRSAYSKYLPGVESRLYEDVHPGWRRAKAALLRARDMLAERDIPLLVALYPTLLRRGEHLVSHDAYAKVMAFCEQEGIAALDLEPVFAGRDMAEMRAHVHDSHPGPEAHRLAAAAIAENLMGGVFADTDAPR
jgi:hypothetical protein